MAQLSRHVLQTLWEGGELCLVPIAKHHWWDWYAPYLSARQNGSSPEEAAAVADRYMEEVLHVLPR
jgi:hypothetical protein